MIARAVSAAAGLAMLGLVAAGCGGGSKSPSVASLGTAQTTTTTPAASGGQAPPKNSAAAQRDFAKFASCMQKHGVNAQVGQGGVGISINAAGGPNSPTLQAAQKACQKLLPGGGPPTLTPAQQAQQQQALRKLAACMRRNGVPDFPDPSGSNGAFKLNTGGAGSDINPNSTAFQNAMTKCQGAAGKGPLRIRIQAGGP